MPSAAGPAVPHSPLGEHPGGEGPSSLFQSQLRAFQIENLARTQASLPLCIEAKARQQLAYYITVAESFQHQPQPCQDLAAEQLPKNQYPQEQALKSPFVHRLPAERCSGVWDFEPAEKFREKAPGSSLEVELKKIRVP
ncbi:hypothetical protein llap_11914 [Limosa lapponica baueri]|uniref:Uncharacterized protein n=1 Tax=Limosa lapponica baueri TaxID=1758121 RepID=A0A2I0TVF5_LIMLA|nr:hypothetical protein llap_11914 [Limosa lapponica baueri]